MHMGVLCCITASEGDGGMLAINTCTFGIMLLKRFNVRFLVRYFTYTYMHAAYISKTSDIHFLFMVIRPYLVRSEH